MSLTSMTGFGTGQSTSKAWRMEVELSSVNRRQFDCILNLPRELAALELRAQAVIRGTIRRGYVRGVVRLQGASDLSGETEAERCRRQITALRDIAAELGLRDDLAASSLLRLPPDDRGAGGAPAPTAATVQPLLEAALTQALEALTAMRRTEGAALAADLRIRLEALREILPALRDRSAAMPAAHRTTLERRMRDLKPPFPPDDPALLREIALLADRCDVSEELTRLASHLDQAITLLDATEPCGRTYDFLCQELLREINTTGSKAGDTELAKLVIRFKSELEAIREQVQNIE